MTVTIVPYIDFAKYNVQTGAGVYNLPMEDVSAVYGPGWPIAPVPRPEDSEVPREIDYPVTVNSTLQPRIGYEGLMPINALKAAYGNVVEAAIPVNMIIRELSGFVPMLKNKVTKQRIPDGHPFEWLTESPDRINPFNVWLTRYKKSAKIYAAPAFFMRRDGKGEIDALEYIDGSTLFLIINARGRLPEPNEIDPDISRYLSDLKAGVPARGPVPELVSKYLTAARRRVQQGKTVPMTTPAFTQVIKGIPFSFWDKSQVYFVPEPPAPAVDSPYGESFIERSWTWIQLIALLTAFELGHYRTGNMPEGFASMPKEWFPTMTKLAFAEKEFNARMASGSQTQHARIRFGPEGMKYLPTKKPDFPDKLYTTARHNIFYALGVPTSEIGERSSRGLGGKGFEQGAAHDMTRQILESEKRGVEDAFNQVLINSGVDDAEFYMDYPQEEIDPSIQQESLWNQLAHGTMTLNDVLTAQNKQVIGKKTDKDNIANMHLIVAGQSIYVLEKMVADASGLISPAIKTQPPGNPPAEGGSPADAEGAIGKEHTPDDAKTIAKFIKAMEETDGKSADSPFYSIPVVKSLEDVAHNLDMQKAHSHNKCFNCDAPPTKDVIWANGFGRAWFCAKHFAEFKGKRKVEAVNDIDGVAPVKWEKKDAKKIDVPSGVDEHEWEMGMQEEQEHAETVGGDQLIIANIVMDHLSEDPGYYTHLKGAEKRYKVKGTTVYNIDTGKPVPGGHHKTKADAEAHLRALYANVPDARKSDMADHDGAMVAVFIPQNVAAKLRDITDGLKLPGDAEREDEGNMHVTLSFIPDGELADMHSEEIIKYMKIVALSYNPLEGNIQGFGVFNGQDGRHVLYATLDCPDLPFIRNEVCELLGTNGIPYGRDHGFVPHITLAYFSDNWQIPEGFMIPDMPVRIDGLTLALGKKLTTVTFQEGGVRLGKNRIRIDWDEYFKHCGVCEEDDIYFNAPITRQIRISLPVDHHANDVEIVAMVPEGMPAKPALWKPEGGEDIGIQERLGGPQYVREEAAWLLSQCLGFELVPLAYVCDSDGEQGAVIWYTAGNTAPREDLSTYKAECVEHAAVLDYIMTQMDRGIKHNYFTHPDEPERIILIDNGYAMPGNKEKIKSVFCEYMLDKPLSDATLSAINMCLGDESTWRDVQDALSTGGNSENAKSAVALAKACAQRLLDDKSIKKS